jgi:hypothetical protein
VLRLGLSTSALQAGGESIACAAGGAGELWRAPLATLQQWLQEHPARRARVQVVLSGRLVRWQLLPWRAELNGPAEQSAYARARFREIYGAAADHWQVLQAVQPPGLTVPACAVDVALMEALQQICQQAGATLESVQPYFGCAFDRWNSRLKGKTVWFGVVEPDCTSLALLRKGQWMGLHSQRTDGNWREALPGMMAQMGIAAGLDDEVVPIYLAGNMPEPQPQAALPFSWLRARGIASEAAALRLAQGV